VGETMALEISFLMFAVYAIFEGISMFLKPRYFSKYAQTEERKNI